MRETSLPMLRSYVISTIRLDSWNEQNFQILSRSSCGRPGKRTNLVSGFNGVSGQDSRTSMDPLSVLFSDISEAAAGERS